MSRENAKQAKRQPQSSSLTGALQRQCACGQHTVAGGKCATCRKKRLALQRRSANYAEPTTVPPMVYEVLRSSGQPLDAETRAFMEPRFGHNFSGVRVHTDAKAAESARAVNALAYTVGRDVVFGAGQYAPSITAGKRLLAHELTHVVQQNQRYVNFKSVYSQKNDQFEREAEYISNAVVNATSKESMVPHITGSNTIIQRQIESPDDFLEATIDEEDKEVQDGDSPSGPTIPIGDIAKSEQGLEVLDDETMAIAGIQFKKPKPKTNQPTKSKKTSRTIKTIDIDLSSQKMTIIWSDGKKDGPITISSGKGRKKGWKPPNSAKDVCKDPNQNNSNCTPVGSFTIGKKGGRYYKNKRGDAMAWYVELEGSGADNRGIGVHNSQIVNGTPLSHGCIRVNLATSKLINKNVTKKTIVKISGKAPISVKKKPTKEASPKKIPSSKPKTASQTQNNMLQRKCACGQHTAVGGECAECRQKRIGLQRQTTNHAEPTTAGLLIKPLNDRYEQEADNVSNSVSVDQQITWPYQLSPAPVSVQRRCIGERWQYEYDGCSIPEAIRIIIGATHGDNPAGGSDTHFANSARNGPCDRHDRCYQTCNYSHQARAACDRQMYEDMKAACRQSRTSNVIKARCFHFADVYYVGLRQGGSNAFYERQKDVCSCETGDVPSPRRTGGASEIFADDNQVRDWVSRHDLGTISRLPTPTKTRLINILLDGWVSDEDIAIIEKTLGAVVSPSEMGRIRKIIEPRLIDLGNIGQRIRIRLALDRL